jgi:hypothetical protein
VHLLDCNHCGSSRRRGHSDHFIANRLEQKGNTNSNSGASGNPGNTSTTSDAGGNAPAFGDGVPIAGSFPDTISVAKCQSISKQQLVI